LKQLHITVGQHQTRKTVHLK